MKDKSIYSKYKIKSRQDLDGIIKLEEYIYLQYMYPHKKDYL